MWSNDNCKNDGLSKLFTLLCLDCGFKSGWTSFKAMSGLQGCHPASSKKNYVRELREIVEKYLTIKSYLLLFFSQAAKLSSLRKEKLFYFDLSFAYAIFSL